MPGVAKTCVGFCSVEVPPSPKLQLQEVGALVEVSVKAVACPAHAPPFTENELAVDQHNAGRSTFKNVGHTDRDGYEIAAETLTGGLSAKIWQKIVIIDTIAMRAETAA